MSDYDPKYKAIETLYAGYRMRSRLEARWAVFFDEMKIKWEYECEGYELPSGRYLPDFRLPEWKSFVEVKPYPIEGRDLARAIDLVKATKHSLIQCDGTPELTNYWMLSLAYGWPDPQWIDFVWTSARNRPWFGTGSINRNHTIRLPYGELGDTGDDEESYKEKVGAAIDAARSMRFGD